MKNKLKSQTCNRYPTEQGIVPIRSGNSITMPSEAISGDNQPCQPCRVEINLVDFSCTIDAASADDACRISTIVLPHITEARNNNYKKQTLTKMKTNKKVQDTILLIATGGFWVGLLLGIFHILISVAVSNIDWPRFLTVMTIFPIMFTLVGAFLLRSTGQMGEKGFMQLIKVTLVLNFSIFKVLKHLKK